MIIASRSLLISLWSLVFSHKKKAKDQRLETKDLNQNPMTILTKDNFDQEVLQSKVPVYVDFFATWCGPCRAFAPIFEEFAQEMGDKIKAYKFDVDSSQDLAARYEVQTIPTIVLFKQGKVAERVMGVKSKEELRGMLEKEE